jgi:sugar lactone lactonase YvrE
MGLRLAPVLVLVMAAWATAPTVAQAATCPGSTIPDGCPWLWAGGFDPFDNPTDVAALGDGTIAYTIAGDNQVGVEFGDSQFTRFGKPGDMDNPSGVAFDPLGNVFVSNTGASTVQLWTTNGKLLRTLVTTGGSSPFYSRPRGIYVDRERRTYIADSGNNRIVILDGNLVNFTELSGVGLNNPTDVWVDYFFNIYVADTGNNRVVRFGNSSQVDTFRIPGSAFVQPTGVVVDDDNNRVFAIDTGNDRIAIFDPSGKFIAAWGNKGNGEGQMDAPMGGSVDPYGNLFIADSGNGSIDFYAFAGAVAARAEVAARAATVGANRTVRVPVRCSTRLIGRCTGTLAIRRGRQRASTRFSILSGQTTPVRLRLTREHHALVRVRGRLAHKVVVRTDRSTRRGSTVRRARLVLRRAR